MSPELEDDVDRRFLKHDRVERRAAKEGLHLVRVQVTKPVRGILAQKLPRCREIRLTDKCDTSEGSRSVG